MGIVNSDQFYKKAFKSNYAIGGFQAYNMEMVQGIIEAAAEQQSPVIVQCSCRGVRYGGAETIYQIARLCSERLHIPVVLHLDHGDSIQLCKQVIDAGFSSVMLDNTDLSIEEQIKRTQEVVEYAHDRGASVEGEIALKFDGDERWLTTCEDAVRFVSATQCDSLSICVGNSHALYGRGFPNNKTPRIRQELIEQIHSELPNLPLVLHSIAIDTPELSRRFAESGGVVQDFGVFSQEELHLAMIQGVVKCNVGIDKTAMTAGIREYLKQHPQDEDPRNYLGFGKTVMEQAVSHLT